MKYLMGIDIGTSGTKTALFDITGRAISIKTVEYPMYQPNNGWAEQEPSQWWEATVEGIQCVLKESKISSKDIGGIGLSGQMHGLVMLDSEGKVLRRSIIWCDQRTDKECQEINDKIGEKRVIEITANPPMTGFTAAKILWVQKNEPELYERCAHILLPKDYIRFKLTGEYATEVSDASGMQLMDISNRCWSDEMLTKLNIDRSLLADMYESPQITGNVHTEAAELTGLTKGTPVVGGAGDNPAAAIGTGVVKSGRAFTTIGSSAVVYAVSDEVKIDLQGRVHSLCASVPGKWTVMSCTQGAGLSLKWLRDTCCTSEIQEAKEKGVDIYDIMSGMAEEIAAGSGGLIYLPYLMGERSPHPDPFCRGVFFGLSPIHTRANMVRAVMEGVAYSQKECVDVFREMGVDVNDMTITGGGGRSGLWRQMLADLYACPVSTLQVDEGAALGVALLAGTGVGIYGDLEQACDAVIMKGKTQQPDMKMHKAYEPYFQLYKKLYLHLKDDFYTLHSI